MQKLPQEFLSRMENMLGEEYGLFLDSYDKNKIQGLRILLNDEYKLDTENIWFSSNNEYNGTKASNWPMILKEEKSN